MRRRLRPLLSALFVTVLATVVAAPAAVLGAPPILAMTFGPDSIPLNGTSTLNFTIINPETNGTLTGLAFSDTLPPGLSVVNGSTTVCWDNGGNLTTSGGSTISFTRASLLDGYICQFSVTVTGTSAGAHVNTTGSIHSTNGGDGVPATATLTVVAPPVPPTIAKHFGAATVVQGDSTSLTFTITNPNSATALTGIGFSDTFPGGLVVGYPNGLTGSCGSGTITAVASTSIVALAGASLDALASCTFSIDVIGAAQGTWTNTTGNVTSIEGGTGGTASATITVGIPPTLTMAFNPPSIPRNGTSELTITLSNPEVSNIELLDVGLTDTLPPGLTVVNGSTTVCWGNPNNLTTSGGHTIALVLPNLPADWSCSFTVTVMGPGVAGAYTNTAGPISSSNGDIPSNIASATLFVLNPPTLAMAFDPATITLGGHTPLTFTVTNPALNAADVAGVAVTASLPAGLTVANDSLGVCGGTLTTSGGNTVSLSGAMVAVGSTCTFSVNVTGAAPGVYTATGGPVTSANAGTGNAATAGVSVVAAATPTPPAATTPPPATTPPAGTTPPAATTPAAGTTPPATSTSRSEAPRSSDPRVPLLLLLASIAGFVAVRRAENRGKYQGPR